MHEQHHAELLALAQNGIELAVRELPAPPRCRRWRRRAAPAFSRPRRADRAPCPDAATAASPSPRSDRTRRARLRDLLVLQLDEVARERASAAYPQLDVDRLIVDPLSVPCTAAARHRRGPSAIAPVRFALAAAAEGVLSQSHTSGTKVCACMSTTFTRRPPIDTSRRRGGACSAPSPVAKASAASANPAVAPAALLKKSLRLGLMAAAIVRAVMEPRAAGTGTSVDEP